MIELLYFIPIVLISYGVGKTFLQLFVKKSESGLEDFVFSSGLGLGVMAYVVYVVGSLRALYRINVIIIIFVCAIIALYPVIRFFKQFSLKKTFQSFYEFSLFEKFLFAVIVFMPSICLFGALAPEIGNDALAYHLFHPKIFIQNHKIGYIPFTRESLWPYLTEMLFTLGLILKSAPLAKLFHYFFGILSAAAVFSFVRRFFSRREALLSTALFYSAPGIFMQSVYAYIDLAQCFYAFVAFFALMLWVEKKEIKLLMLAGIFTGLLLSVKLLGGIVLISLTIILAYESIRAKFDFKKIVFSILIFWLFAGLFSFVWYLRSYLILYNPVYPLLHNIFGSGWETQIGIDLGVRRDILGFFRLPWDLVMHIDSFGGEQIGVIFLAFLPFVLFNDFRHHIIRYISLYLVLYALIWFFIDPNIRFAFVNVALVFILISCGIFRVADKFKLGLVKIALVLLVIFNSCLCVYYNKDSISLALGKITSREYLFRKERTYPIAEFVNNNLPSSAVLILADESRGYYFERQVIYYPTFRLQSKCSLSGYLEKLHHNRVEVYLLSLPKTIFLDSELTALVKEKMPVYQRESQIQEGISGVYQLFKL
jgi:hypothetical protein